MNTKIVTQRAVMGANIINFKAQVIYNANGNLIEETFVKWDDSGDASDTFIFRTKDIDFGEPAVRKKIYRVRIF